MPPSTYSLHALPATIAEWWVVWSPTWRGLPARKALRLQPQVSWELQGPRELWTDFSLERPLCCEQSCVSGERESTSTFHTQESESEVAQSCPTLCDPMDCSLLGSSLHGILQARILELVAISFSRGFSQLRDRTRISRIAGRCFYLWAIPRKPATTPALVTALRPSPGKMDRAGS